MGLQVRQALARRSRRSILWLSIPILTALFLAVLAPGCGNAPGASPSSPQQIRVAVIGGMVETGFWAALVERFHQATGNRYKIELVIMGPKHIIADAFRKGKADLITMHACDNIINLVADGDAVDPQPWLRNDMIIVGPHDDPAKIRGAKTAAEAFTRIASSGAPFVVHASLGAQEVMRDILEADNINMPSDHLTLLFSDRARDVLKVAAEKHAYTLVGRIPFLNGKLPNAGLEVMVRGDPRLRRPYIVATANPRHFPQAHVEGALELAAFLRKPETQEWIKGFGVSQLDDQPLFFPVNQ
jgi:tungstate transport system substrate-binding protein